MEMAMNDAAINGSTPVAGADVRTPYRVFVPSWLAYVHPFIVLVCFGVVGGLMVSLVPLAGTVMLLAALALFAYQVLYIHSFKLFTQEDGVWVYSGVFPWNKGVYGVKWRDLNEATFRQGFIGWLFKSYKVTLTNRYTANNEIILPHIKNGHEAAAHINDLHIGRVRAGDVPENEVSQG